MESDYLLVYRHFDVVLGASWWYYANGWVMSLDRMNLNLELWTLETKGLKRSKTEIKYTKYNITNKNESVKG